MGVSFTIRRLRLTMALGDEHPIAQFSYLQSANKRHGTKGTQPYKNTTGQSLIFGQTTMFREAIRRVAIVSSDDYD